MNRLTVFLDRMPLLPLLAGALLLGLAPFVPEPHLVEKLRMLSAGELTRPIDIFDLIMHGGLPLLAMAKLLRMAVLHHPGT
jgi:hypothetical protein